MEPHGDAITRQRTIVSALPMPQRMQDALQWSTELVNALPSSSAAVRLRVAGADDMRAVHAMVCELAEFEREPDGVKIGPEELVRDGFGPWCVCWVTAVTPPPCLTAVTPPL
jgi:hypothetical protein